MHPIQTEMLVKLVLEDRQREAARHRSVRSIRRRAVPTWRSRLGGLLENTGLALQGASRARRGTDRGQVDCPQLAPDPC
ncbi:MAG: hypothetical protein ACRDYW_12755 [Acidimicrobiales bacterium]